MALFDLTSPAVAERGASPVSEAREKDLDAVLVREQYRSLARTAPYYCGVAIIGAVMLRYASPETPSGLDATLLLAALAFVLIRLVYWLKVRPHIERQSLAVIRRDLRQADIEIPVLTFVFALLATTTFGQADMLEKSLWLVASWITAAACALCLMRLARAAVLVVAAATAPIAATLALCGWGLGLWLAALIIVASGLIGYMLIENSRVFSEIVGSRFVIAEMHRSAENARQAANAIANTDYLTGLPNRRFLHSLLADRVRADGSGANPFAVGLVDLDGFKPINDIHGHQAGDTILRQVGDRLAEAIKGRGNAARMGGDEFAVIWEGVGSQDEAMALGRELRKIFAKPFIVDQLAVHVGCTLGFALFPTSADEPERLIRLADVALYRAKAGRRGSVCVFDKSDERAAIARARLEQALHRAVADSSIDVHFQPIVDLASGRVSGFESLARWTDPQLGVIEPSVFIPAAERIGLIDELSHGLLSKAAAAASRWPGDIALSFNLSAAQLVKPNAGDDIVTTLNESGLSPARLEIELTETAILKDLPAARATIETLRAAGVRVALDDFGAGYSGLAQVRDLELDRIKIDKSFVDRVCLDPKIASLTRAIVDMARRLDLPCVAEGIESVEQLEELKLGGCAGGQGWLFAHAMPEAFAARFIAEGRALA